MDRLTLLAQSLGVIMKGLRTVRVGPSAPMSNAEIAGNAHGLSYAILATSWQRRNRVPAWTGVYEAWQKRVNEVSSVDPSLYGFLQPDDRFELLTGNAAAFRKRDELYRSATRSIDISTYYIQADEVGWRTARALADCARRGIRVRIVADNSITERKSVENKEVRKLIAFLRDAGVDYRLFRNPERPYDVCHRKLLIVDGHTLITGGRNYADHYAGDEWRDIDLLLSGPSVTRLQPVFEETFTGVPMPRNEGNRENLFQPAEPANIESNGAFIYLLECIRDCRRTLDIENAYYFNHPAIYRQLADACRRGVRVRLFTNSAASNDLSYMNYRLYLGFPQLIDAGVELYLRRGAGRTLHCKYFVADGEMVGFGSSNLDFFSPRFCYELGLNVKDHRLADALTAWFEEGLQEADRLRDIAVAEAVVSKEGFGKYFDRAYPDIQ